MAGNCVWGKGKLMWEGSHEAHEDTKKTRREFSAEEAEGRRGKDFRAPRRCPNSQARTPALQGWRTSFDGQGRWRGEKIRDHISEKGDR
jgi:hypothetical protein